MNTELTWPNAIIAILNKAEKPLSYNEITSRILSEGLRQNFGATPSATVSAKITSSIKHKKELSPFLKTEAGIVLRHPGLIQNLSLNVNIDQEKNLEPEKLAAQYDIITSFGMFWKREAVEWLINPRLLGMRSIGADPINFNKQFGIYLLYDGREVIYVGRTTDRPLGRRLYEHTIDRLSTRWDRFSWFGLLPISEEGEISSLPCSYSASKLIPALEAVLIEALEPRQNRKRGDDLASVEYIQEIDPAIEKKKVKASLAAAFDRL